MRRTALLLATAALLTACTDQPATTEATLRTQQDVAAVNKDLALLRQVTAQYQQFDRAAAAGWSTQITPCMADPGGSGAMGFHYGNVALIDGTASVDKPQLLLYEPEKNGRLRLVAVEYIIPYTFVPRSAEPPVLFGQQFARVDAFGLWGLHAWVWKENSAGMFAPWNPKVTCANTSNVMRMNHN